MECPQCGYVMDAFTMDCPRCQRLGPAVAKTSAQKETLRDQEIPQHPAPPDAVPVQYCGVCGAGMEAEARHCPGCGTAVPAAVTADLPPEPDPSPLPATPPAARYCAGCGGDITPPDAAFCPGCGQPVAQQAPFATPSRTHPRTFLFVLLAAALIFVGVLCYNFLQRRAIVGKWEVISNSADAAAPLDVDYAQEIEFRNDGMVNIAGLRAKWELADGHHMKLINLLGGHDDIAWERKGDQLLLRQAPEADPLRLVRYQERPASLSALAGDWRVVDGGEIDASPFLKGLGFFQDETFRYRSNEPTCRCHIDANGHFAVQITPVEYGYFLPTTLQLAGEGEVSVSEAGKRVRFDLDGTQAVEQQEALGADDAGSTRWHATLECAVVRLTACKLVLRDGDGTTIVLYREPRARAAERPR